VPEATMTRRITRAKQRIRDSGIPFALPPQSERTQRLAAVLHVLYLVFNEGYASTSGPLLQRVELTAEAIRLARMVHRLLPDDGEVTGLLALMLLTDARRPARSGPDGTLIPMAEQDRSRWDPDAIAEGVALVTDALAEDPSAPTSCRQPSPRSTTKRRMPRRPTGRRSWRCTSCCCVSPTTLWCG
jgi:predicted RNA polymerase sigma factor